MKLLYSRFGKQLVIYTEQLSILANVGLVLEHDAILATIDDVIVTSIVLL